MMDLQTLRARLERGERFRYLLFFGHRVAADGSVGPNCLSQWYPAPFVVEGTPYPTAEHYMMAEKARLFGDAEYRELILAAPTPAAAKKLGRGVRGFDQTRWEKQRCAIVRAASLAKFSQNETLGRYLRQTHPRVLVEASPRDRIWGIGLGAKDPRAGDPLQWRGLNLLGFALMAAREQLRQGG
jgi:ribA/ribD-fused uncharacterized protein